MFNKDSIGLLIGAVGFFVAGLLELMGSNLVFGFSFIALGFVFLTLKFLAKKKVVDFTLMEKDEAFILLISKGEKIKAIKRCRSLINCGLKEAADYVDSIL